MMIIFTTRRCIVYNKASYREKTIVISMESWYMIIGF